MNGIALARLGQEREQRGLAEDARPFLGIGDDFFHVITDDSGNAEERSQ